MKKLIIGIVIGLGFVGLVALADTGTVNVSTFNTLAALISGSHIVYPTSTFSVPTLGTCGTGSQIASGSTDMSGTINTAGVVTACTMNFGTNFVNTSTCIISDNNTAITAAITALSSSSATFSFSLSLGTGQIYYKCN